MSNKKSKAQSIINSFLKKVLVVDTETTALNLSQGAEVCELGCAYYDRGNIVSTDALFGTVGGINPKASAVNNISARMLVGKPTIVENDSLFSEILQLNEDNSRVFYVAHNAEFDRKFAVHYLTQLKNQETLERFVKREWICTLDIARKLYEKSKYLDHRLGTLNHYFDLNTEEHVKPHRASFDCETTLMLLRKMCQDLLEMGDINTVEELESFLLEMTDKSKLPALDIDDILKPVIEEVVIEVTQEVVQEQHTQDSIIIQSTEEQSVSETVQSIVEEATEDYEDMVLWFGPYCGTRVSKAPDSHLTWLVKICQYLDPYDNHYYRPDLRACVMREMEKRGLKIPQSNSTKQLLPDPKLEKTRSMFKKVH